MSGTRQLAAIAMVAVMVLAGGCAGWGTDGPSDGEADADDADDDLEETDDEAQDGQDDQPDGGDGGVDDGSDEGGDGDGSGGDAVPSASDSDTESDADSETGSDSDTDADSRDRDAADADDASGDGAGDAGDGDSVDDTGENGDPDDEGPYGTLTVTVEDGDGERVEGVEVVGIGLDAEIYSADTDEDGRATFDLIDGEYTWHVTTDGTEYDESSEEDITMDGDDESIALTVHADDDDGDETHTLTVTVTDPNDDPVEDEGVHVVTYDGGQDVASGTTDEDGTVRFDLENGDYEVAVSAPERGLYQPSDNRLVTIDGEDAELPIQLRSPDSDDTATGVVRVVDQNGDPVEGEPVTLAPPGTVEDDAKETRHTDENGEVVIELAAGDPTDVVMYTVEVRDQTERLGIMSDEHAGVQEVTFDVGIDPGEPNHTATGKVVVFDGADRVEGEPVTIEYEDGSMSEFETDENGEVVLEFPKDASDEITTVHAHVRDRTKSMIIETDEEHGVQRTVFQLEPQLTKFETTIYVENDQGERLEGEVVEARAPPGDGEWEEIGTTDENGAVVLTGQSSDPSDVIQFEVRVQGYDQEPLQTFVDDSEHEETIVIESQKTCEADFDSHHEAQSYFEEAPLERGHLDKDNDGVACEDHTSPDAKAIVIVEDEDGNPVAGESVMIDGQSVETNEAGVASMTFDFGGESGSETVDISVRDEEMTLTVENDQGDYLDEKSNIVEITVEPAAQEAVTAGSQGPVAVML